MNTAIKRLRLYCENHIKLRQWLWFIGLWFAGLLTIVIVTYPIKLLIRYLR